MAGDESRFPFLDRGEAAALALAVELQADLILADDREARTMAKSLGIKTIGTIGILAEAHRATLVDFDQAIDELRQTNFHIQDSVIAGVRERLAKEPISINQIP
jgi:predicted nucleic acid-binding protein